MAPRRSRRKHTPLDDNSTISSGGTSGNGLTYTMPNNYRTKTQKPSLVEKTQTEQLSKLPLPPPRPRRYRSARSMSSTVASGTTYTTNVSKVSIHSREPVLDSNDPLSRAMQDQIAQSAPPVNNPLPDKKKQSPPERVTQSAPFSGGVSPTMIETAAPTTTTTPVSTTIEKSEKGGPVVVPPPPPPLDPHQSPLERGTQSALPRGLPAIIEAIPTAQVSSTSAEPSGKLPPPPSLDLLETYSFATNDSPRKAFVSQEGRNWKKLGYLVSIVLLLVVGAVVVSVVVVLGNKDDNGAGGGKETIPSQKAPTAAPSLRPSTTQQQVPTAVPAFAPILPPIGGTDDTVPNLEQLIDYFADKNPGTALGLLDTTSPEYRAMQWLAEDVEQNSFTLAEHELRIVQRGVLSILYYSTLGEEQWIDRTGWLDSTLSECEWFGTECIQGEETILALVLEGNGLGGNIPRELFFMESLEQLVLSENQIGSSIPTSIGQLSLLKHLELTQNVLTGSIPTAIGLLTNIESLELNDNAFSGSLPNVFAPLSLLQNLGLLDNLFSGTIPPSITALSSLRFLYMSENALEGTLSWEIGFLTNLEEFDVYFNQLSGFLPTEFGLLTKLSYLVVADNNLAGPIPETLGLAASLVGISLSNNTMTGIVPATLGLLQNIQFLQLNGNDFVGEVPLELCNLAASELNTQIWADCQLPEIECDCCQLDSENGQPQRHKAATTRGGALLCIPYPIDRALPEGGQTHAPSCESRILAKAQFSKNLGRKMTMPAPAAEEPPTSTCTRTTTCHWLPCTMDHDGMAPVHIYFAPQAVDNNDEEVVQAAQLRGRGLLSVVVPSPSPQQQRDDATGGILQISNGGAIRLEASFENIIEWHHEHSIAAVKRQVSQLDTARNLCQVARAVHDPIPVEDGLD